MGYEKEIIEYILYRQKCVHPFRVSRILLLAEWNYNEKYGEKLSNFKYVAETFAFYVEGLKDILDELIDSGCAVLRQDKKCIEYLCSRPDIPEKVSSIIDEVIDKTDKLSDRELNRIIINDVRYHKLLHGE